MATIGHFGNVKFYVTNKKGKPRALSFNNAAWKSSANYEEHKRMGKKPLLEYVGNNLDEFTMDIYVSAFLLQSPMMIVEEIRKYCLQAKAYPLVIGKKRIGKNKYVITEVSNNLNMISRKGKLMIVGIAVTFREYPLLKKKSKKTKVSKKKNKNSNSGKKKQSKKNGTKKDAFKKAKKKYTVYKAKKDTTLWAIAKKKYGKGYKYKKIFEANRKKSSGFHQMKSISETVKKGWRLKIPK